MNLTLTLLAETLTIYRLAPDAEIPQIIFKTPFFAITRTEDELSLVLPETVEVESDKLDAGWVCFKVEGPLEFTLVGILSGIAEVLAVSGVPIFALSTFGTDYILVKQKQAKVAVEALETAGYQVLQGV